MKLYVIIESFRNYRDLMSFNNSVRVEEISEKHKFLTVLKTITA